MDGLLRTFFRRQTPQPWPALALPAPHSGARGASGPWPRRGLLRRVGVAASLLLLVAGYLALASRFPAATSESGPAINADRTLGVNELDRVRRRAVRGAGLAPAARSGEAVEPTRNGGEALLQWEQLPGGLFMRIEEKRPPQR
jgi:hypothetical protein